MKKPLIVAMTGASGAPYGVRLVQALLEVKQPVCFVMSDTARIVIREELNISIKSSIKKEDLEKLFSQKLPEDFQAFGIKDFTASIASGSYATQGMVIVPSTMGTLGAIASGVSQNLIHRAADCVLKEGRKLVIVPRETPLNAIHLENMLKLSRAGARIVPAMPGFYAGVQTVDDLVDFMVGKILDQFEIPHTLYARWTGLTKEGMDRSLEQTL